MTMTRKKRPRDPVQLGKLIVDIATGQTEDRQENPTVTQAGGREGGIARGKKLSPEQRSQIAAVAAQARWKKS